MTTMDDDNVCVKINIAVVLSDDAGDCDYDFLCECSFGHLMNFEAEWIKWALPPMGGAA